MKLNGTLINMMVNILNTNGVPLLLGEPGIGKSSIITDLAKNQGTECFVLACNQLADKADLTGARLVPVQDKNGTVTDYEQVFYPHATIRRAIAYALKYPKQHPILFLDEINRTTSDVTSAILSLITARAIGNTDIPKNLRIIAAGNDKGNVTILDDASVSRFIALHVVPDVNTFFEIHPDLNEHIKNVLTKNPETLFAKGVSMNVVTSDTDDDNDDDNSNQFSIDEIVGENEELIQLTTPRTIAGLSRYLNSVNNTDLKMLIAETTTTVTGETTNGLQELIYGYTGTTTFSQLLYAEITSALTTNSSSAQSVTKLIAPPIYSELKQCTSRDEINDKLSALTPSEHSSLLLFCLQDDENNADIINATAPLIDNFEQGDLQKLLGFVSNQTLNDDNVEAFVKTRSNIAKAFDIILNAN